MTTSSVSDQRQRQRQIKYGLNVLVASVVAVLVVVMVNLIAAKYLKRVRIDATHSRKYSLSDQTRKVIEHLKHDYRVVTLIATSDDRLDDAKSVIEEYENYSDKLTVDHMNPMTSSADRFYTALLERYTGELEPLQSAIAKGREAVDEARKLVAEQTRSLGRLDEHPHLAAGQQKLIIGRIIGYLARFQQDSENLDQLLTRRLDEPLPDLDGILRELTQLLEVPDQTFKQASDIFRQWLDDPTVAAVIKNELIRLSDAFDQVGQRLGESIQQLKQTAAAESYTQVRSELANPDTVVVMGPRQVRVITIDKMFQRLTDEERMRAYEGEHVDQQFTGEEQITGALVSMELDKKPLVIFVSHGAPAVGPGGIYQNVAERLTTMNFDVQQWNPSGGQPPFPGAGPMPPQPPPEPQAGQKVIWVVPPSPPPNPRFPQGAMGPTKVVEQVKAVLEEGQGALLMLGPSQGPMFGGQDPMSELVASWGITADLDRRILSRVFLQDGRELADEALMVDDWPGEHPVTAALRGLGGVFVRTSPLSTQSDQGAVQHWPLVVIKRQGLWAETDQLTDNPKYDASKAADEFLIAAAAQKDGNRLIVVANGLWATDQITGYGLLGPNTANLVGARFPGNAELFVNSVYWLAGLEQLIAASARSQDIRRIEEMPNLAALQWTLPVVMPLAALAAGIGVWMVRRRD